jgi:hypothetical protein
MFQSLEDIKQEVENNGNVLTLPVAEVRDAYGAQRLGVHVRANISKAMRGLGLGHYPQDLPDRRREPVRIYKLGTPAADLIEAVLSPSEESDEAIRERSSGEATKVLGDIRELVCT